MVQAVISPTTAYAERTDWLPDYLMDTRALLHDASADYFSDLALTGFINEGRSHVCIDTGALRKRLTITLPGAQEAFPIGGVTALNGTIPTPAGTAPYTLVSGAGAAATAITSGYPTTVTIDAGGTYYQRPLVTFDPESSQVAIGVTGAAILQTPWPYISGTPQPVASVDVTSDNGAFNANSITPTVIFSSMGHPAQVQDNGAGALELVSPGAGQALGVVILDANGTVTPLTPEQVSILDCNIASIDQMTCIWGSQRVPMRNMAYSDFSIRVRGIVGFQSVPVAFSMISNTLYIGPIPNQAYQYELDCILYPWPLINFQMIGEIMDRSAILAVKYYAAYKAKASQGEAQAAEGFLTLYNQAVQWSVNRYTTRLSQLWPGNEELE